MNKALNVLLAFLTSNLFAQETATPLQKNGYSKPTSYNELDGYIKQIEKSGLVKSEVLAKSVQGRNIFGVKFSSSEFGNDPSKIKVLLLAQQHGNEQGGKEGALLLFQELIKPENKYLFNRIDLVIVPQMNPDGSETNRRKNGNGVDLNRNHLIRTEPETTGLHRLFDKYRFEVTMDIHEYSPYGESWQKYGYRNNSDLLLGSATNSNVSEKLRELSNTRFIPFMKEFLNARNVSNFIYSPGGPPEIDYIRHSTFDINDGRQSFAIQNTLSFIQEGLNGRDGLSDSIKHRAECQMGGMLGLLVYCYSNSREIKKLVTNERKNLINGASASVSIQSEHVRNGKKLRLPLISYSTGNDTVVNISDYRPVVKSIYNVKRPSGYLVPKKLKDVSEWVERQGIISSPYKPKRSNKIEIYRVQSIDSIDFEGDIIINPALTVVQPAKPINPDDYIYLSTNQLKGNMLVIALEPKSMLGLTTYKEFSHLLKHGEDFPVFRVIEK